MSDVVTPQLEDFFNVYIEWTDDLPLLSEAQVNAEVVSVPNAINATAENITLTEIDTPVAVETPADGQTDEPSSTDSGTPDYADASPDDDETKFQRFCAIAEQIVPNKSMWPLVYKPPTEVFDAENLPFDEKTFLCCPANGGYWGSFYKSIAFPYAGSMLTILGSTLAVVTFMIQSTADCAPTCDNVMLFIWIWVLLSTNLNVYFLVEHQAWLLLYYRLWEQKVVIQFKTKRTLFKKITVILVTITVMIEFGYGWFSPNITDKLAYTFVIAIPAFVTAWVVYSSFDIEGKLISYSMAYRHFLTNARSDGLKPLTEDEMHLKCRDKMQRIAQQVKIIPESMVKYDIKALSHYAHKVLAKKIAAANDKTMPEPARSAALAVCEEEKQWIRVLGMWIGRLGNTKVSVQEKWRDVGWIDRDQDAAAFVFRPMLYQDNLWHSMLHQDDLWHSQLYQDDLWHSHGSFKTLPNHTGTYRVAIVLWPTIALYALIAIELYRAQTKQ